MLQRNENAARSLARIAAHMNRCFNEEAAVFAEKFQTDVPIQEWSNAMVVRWIATVEGGR